MKTEKILNDRGELKKIKIEIKEYICKIIKEHNENPKHSEPHNEDVCYKKTGHRELVEVIFDNSKLSLNEVLGIFFKNHNPTQKEGQAYDIGDQYKSCIYYLNEKQKKTIEEEIKKVQKSFSRKIVTEVLKFKNYTLAEEYHQNYLEKKTHFFN